MTNAVNSKLVKGSPEAEVAEELIPPTIARNTEVTDAIDTAVANLLDAAGVKALLTKANVYDAVKGILVGDVTADDDEDEITVTDDGISGIDVEDEGTALNTKATTLDFVGEGVTATGEGVKKTITIPGSSAVGGLGVSFAKVGETIALTGTSIAGPALSDLNDMVYIELTYTLTNPNLFMSTFALKSNLDGMFLQLQGAGGAYVGISDNAGTLNFTNAGFSLAGVSLVMVTLYNVNPGVVGTEGVTVADGALVVGDPANKLSFYGPVTVTGAGASKTITVNAITGVDVEDEGTALATKGTKLNFKGDGVSVANDGDDAKEKIITIPGGSGITVETLGGPLTGLKSKLKFLGQSVAIAGDNDDAKLANITVNPNLAVYNDGAELTPRAFSLNFKGDGVTVVNDADDETKKVVTIPGGSGGIDVEDEGTALTTKATKLNFKGVGVTATNDDNDASEKIITIPGGIQGLAITDESTTLAGKATGLVFAGGGVEATGAGSVKTITIPAWSRIHDVTAVPPVVSGAVDGDFALYVGQAERVEIWENVQGNWIRLGSATHGVAVENDGVALSTRGITLDFTDGLKATGVGDKKTLGLELTKDLVYESVKEVLVHGGSPAAHADDVAKEIDVLTGEGGAGGALIAVGSPWINASVTNSNFADTGIEIGTPQDDAMYAFTAQWSGNPSVFGSISGKTLKALATASAGQSSGGTQIARDSGTGSELIASKTSTGNILLRTTNNKPWKAGDSFALYKLEAAGLREASESRVEQLTFNNVGSGNTNNTLTPGPVSVISGSGSAEILSKDTGFNFTIKAGIYALKIEGTANISQNSTGLGFYLRESASGNAIVTRTNRPFFRTGNNQEFGCLALFVIDSDTQVTCQLRRDRTFSLSSLQLRIYEFTSHTYNTIPGVVPAESNRGMIIQRRNTEDPPYRYIPIPISRSNQELFNFIRAFDAVDEAPTLDDLEIQSRDMVAGSNIEEHIGSLANGEFLARVWSLSSLSDVIRPFRIRFTVKVFIKKTFASTTSGAILFSAVRLYRHVPGGVNTEIKNLQTETFTLANFNTAYQAAGNQLVYTAGPQRTANVDVTIDNVDLHAMNVGDEIRIGAYGNQFNGDAAIRFEFSDVRITMPKILF